MVQSVSTAASAPTAAAIGSRNAPTTPTVRGVSTMVLPSSFWMMRRRTLPSRTRSFTLASTSSPLTLNSSQRESLFIASPFSSVVLSAAAVGRQGRGPQPRRRLTEGRGGGGGPGPTVTEGRGRGGGGG